MSTGATDLREAHEVRRHWLELSGKAQVTEVMADAQRWLKRRLRTAKRYGPPRGKDFNLTMADIETMCLCTGPPAKFVGYRSTSRRWCPAIVGPSGLPWTEMLAPWAIRRTTAAWYVWP